MAPLPHWDDRFYWDSMSAECTPDPSQRVPAADGGQLWPSRDFCARVGPKGSGGDGERTDGASDGFARFRELMRARGRAG